MSKPRCLVIGTTGQLGRALCEYLRRDYEIAEGVRRVARPEHVHLDLCNRQSILTALERTRPAWVVLAAAYCHVDRAEVEHDLCWQVNVLATQTIASYARRQGGRLVYYSTDSVFDGNQSPYHEDDCPHPLNVYSESKAAGERVVRDTLSEHDHRIIRTAWLYGVDPAQRNFVSRLVLALREGRSVPVPHDLWGTPTLADDVALATRVLMADGLSGTYHAAGHEYVSRLTYAERICRAYQLNHRLIRPVSIHELSQRAARPLRVRLACRKLAGAGVPTFQTIDDGLARLQAQSCHPVGAR